MKIAVLACALLASAVNLPTALGWWDNGHMLVGEVASKLMENHDVATIQRVLASWDAQFPNTSTIATAAIWSDQVKCKSVSSYCASPLSPSLSVMDEWHYIDLPYYLNSTANVANLTLFDYKIDGFSIDIMEKGLKSLNTTKSLWGANFVLRNFIHIFGDAHQPLHVIAAVSSDNPGGDGGGNYYTFQAPCAFSNLHALWDAAAGEYSQNNWAPDVDPVMRAVSKNATHLLAEFGSIHDPAGYKAYAKLPWTQFLTSMTTGYGLKNAILDSYTYAPSVYGGLNLTYSGGKVACPSQSYVAKAAKLAKKRITLGGQRLAIVLTQIAKQLRTLGLAK